MYKTKADEIHESRLGMGKTNKCKPVTNMVKKYNVYLIHKTLHMNSFV